MRSRKSKTKSDHVFSNMVIVNVYTYIQLQCWDFSIDFPIINFVFLLFIPSLGKHTYVKKRERNELILYIHGAPCTLHLLSDSCTAPVHCLLCSVVKWWKYPWSDSKGAIVRWASLTLNLSTLAHIVLLHYNKMSFVQ